MLSALILFFAPSVLTVGDGKTYSRIEDAVAAVHPGDTIEVYASSTSYVRTAVRLAVPNVRIKGVGPGPVVVDGNGFEYSGEGRIPRAIIQFDPGSNGSSVSNLELKGAHNNSYNGAGVRINQANRIIVSGCDIHDNDMGIMSNGAQGNEHAAEDQMISHCRIHGNGNLKDPGYNHNLYLGGTSVTVEFCDIFGALTGHNLKSRAHFNLVRHCFIHDSANRECDFVEAWDTERPNSNTVLIGDVIAKDPNCKGNRMTIHFGREKGLHAGTLYMINDTVVTPFYSPVVGMDSPKSGIEMVNNVILNDHESHPALVEATSGAIRADVTGTNNWISPCYDLSKTAIEKGLTGKLALFEDHRVASYMSPVPASYRDGKGAIVPVKAEWRFAGAGKWSQGHDSFIGAG